MSGALVRGARLMMLTSVCERCTIWRWVCQGASSPTDVFGAGGALAGRHERKVQSGRLRGQTDIRGLWLPQDPGFVAARCLRSGRGQRVLAAHSADAGLARRCWAFLGARARPGNVPGARVWGFSVKGCGLPEERGELASARDRDDAGWLCGGGGAGAASGRRGVVGRARRSRSHVGPDPLAGERACSRSVAGVGSRYDVGEVPLRVLLRRRPPEPGVTISDQRALQRLFRA